MQSSFRAVIFDMDGTILDTLDDIADGMNTVLASRGFATHSIESYKMMVGEGMEVLARKALGACGGDDVLVKAVLAEMKRTYAGIWHNKTVPYKGIVDLLGLLRARGVPASVLSNKAHDFAVQMADHYFGKDAFLKVQGKEDGVPPKPDPAKAMELCLLMGVAPSATAFVGDSCIDMQTAVNGGMVPVGALWGFRDRDELERAGARHLCASVDDLKRLLLWA